MNKCSLPIPVILAISHEITQHLESFLLKITKSKEDYQFTEFALHANGEM